MERQATACCRQPEKHSQERLDNPLSDGRITDKKLSTMGEISPGGPASTESEQNSSRVLCGGEERGGLLNGGLWSTIVCWKFKVLRPCFECVVEVLSRVNAAAVQ